MEEPKRYDCGNGDGMFDSDKGYWISYEEHKVIVTKLLEAMNYTRSCISDSEQLPLDNFCKVCNLPTDGEKCCYKRCPV